MSNSPLVKSAHLGELPPSADNENLERRLMQITSRELLWDCPYLPPRDVGYSYDVICQREVPFSILDSQYDVPTQARRASSTFERKSD